MQALSSSAAELLGHFFNSSESKFRFLEERHKFSYLSGLVQYSNNTKIITPFKQHNPGGHFQALTRYERGEVAIEIQFGEAQFFLECFVFYGPFQRFSLADVLNAARKSPQAGIQDWGITSPLLIDQTLERIAKALHTHFKLIVSPSSKQMDRMLMMRDVQIEQAIRRQFEHALKQASDVAARAYREKDYRRVITLLEPYKRHLPHAELKKLQLAKRLLLS